MLSRTISMLPSEEMYDAYSILLHRMQSGPRSILPVPEGSSLARTKLSSLEMPNNCIPSTYSQPSDFQTVPLTQHLHWYDRAFAVSPHDQIRSKIHCIFLSISMHLFTSISRLQTQCPLLHQFPLPLNHSSAPARRLYCDLSLHIAIQCMNLRIFKSSKSSPIPRSQLRFCAQSTYLSPFQKGFSAEADPPLIGN